jgi:anti-sigma28 factor (negative regulator of flagellin synthesis)
MSIEEIGAGGFIEKVSGIKRKNNASKTQQKSAVKADFLDISRVSEFQLKMESVLSEVPDVRQEKVSELQGKFDSHEYKVSNEEIADNILEREEYADISMELFG